MYTELFRKCFLLLIFFSVGMCLMFTELSFGQERFPTKPIRIIVGYPAGGTTDLATRGLAEGAKRAFTQPMVVVNIPGGGATVALASLMKENPDGYSLANLGSAQIVAQYMRDVPFRVKRDFTPIVQFMNYYFGLVVRADAPWKTFKEFIDYAKANPGKIIYGTSDLGTPQHLVLERLALQENIKWKCIPFGGGVPAITALLGGHVEVVSLTSDWRPHVDAGKLRLLVTYGTKRMPRYPDVPTLVDLGYNIARTGFGGIVGPKGIPPERVEILAKAFKRSVDDPGSEFHRVMEKFDLPVEYRGPEEFSKFLKEFDEEVEMFIDKLGLAKK
jgi:tripartite-type tricarboxylate transporter receptor subunit TctC